MANTDKLSATESLTREEIDKLFDSAIEALTSEDLDTLYKDEVKERARLSTLDIAQEVSCYLS